jgi:hypothetical protein
VAQAVADTTMFAALRFWKGPIMTDYMQKDTG